MPTRRSDRGRVMAKMLREQPGLSRFAAELLDPTPVSDVVALKEDPTNPLNYLAAIPIVGNAAAFARAIRRSNVDELPKEYRWRFDDDASPEEMKKVFAEEFVTDLEANDVAGKQLMDSVEELKGIDQELYEAVGEELPDYLKRVDAEDLKVSELVEMGYPKSTARKIASGELPMDAASRRQRMQEQGWEFQGYHTGDSRMVVPDSAKGLGLPEGAQPRHLFMSKDPAVSNTYHMIPRNTTTYPMAIRDPKVGRLDAGGREWSDLTGLEYVDSSGGRHTVPEEFFETDDVARMAEEMGDTTVVFDDIVDHASHVDAARAVRPDSEDYLGTMDYLRKGHDVTATSAPARSVLGAAFDPDMIDSKNILASLTAVPTAGMVALLLRQQAREEKDNET